MAIYDSFTMTYHTPITSDFSFIPISCPQVLAGNGNYVHIMETPMLKYMVDTPCSHSSTMTGSFSGSQELRAHESWRDFQQEELRPGAAFRWLLINNSLHLFGCKQLDGMTWCTGSPHREALSQGILRLQESGRMKEILDR